MILKNTKLKNELRKRIKNSPLIEDILLFGSSVRGKEKPNDIDIIVIFKEKIDKADEYEIRKLIENHYENISIISKTKKTVLEDSFDARESMLFEATSIITGNNLAREYGFEPLGMFKYSFDGWTKLQKTKFYYALNGRGEREGMVDRLKCIKLSDNIILVPLENIEEMKDFLELWKIKYRYIPTLIPKRLNKKRILS